jgi:hypothetical protein
METPKIRQGLLNNPQFQEYLRNLPTIHRRIVSLPGQGEPIVIEQVGDGPFEVAREAPQENNEKGESNGISE